VTITWGAPQLPDLAIVSVALLDAGGAPLAADPTEGDSISVAVDIVNNGTAAATSFEVGLYYNPGAAPEVGEPADRTKVVGSLAVGAQTALTFTGVTSPVAGLWRMYLLADSGGVVTESAEPNNVAGPVSVNWGGIAGIEVTAPNGGEAWQAGAAHRITWRSFGDIGSQDVRIDYSADGGASWNLIVAATRDDGVYDWTVPAEDSIRCLVRVTAAAGASPPSDESDGEFSIVPAGIGRPDLRVVAISPGANVYPVGTAIEIAVAVRNSGTAGAGFCRVDLFCDARSMAPAPGETGANYAWVDSPAPGSETTVVFGGITSNVTTNWNVYAVVSPVPMESDETNNVGGPVPIGWSDNPNAVNSLGLVSPNGGEVLEVGMACVVRWSLTGNPGSYVYLDVSLDGGATWQELERGLVTGARSYTWTVDVEPVAEARLRISNSLGTVTDVSDGVFTILPEGGNAPLYIGSGCASSLGRRCGAAGWLGLFLAALCLRCVARRPAGDKERPRE